MYAVIEFKSFSNFLYFSFVDVLIFIEKEALMCFENVLNFCFFLFTYFVLNKF